MSSRLRSTALRFLGGFVAFSALTSCGRAPDVHELRIGVLALSDERYLGASGVPTREGATLAAEEINASGGIDVAGERYLVRLVPLDHADRVEDATTQARRLINRDSVHAIVGPQLSRHAIPVAAIADDARVPLISPMSSNPETTRGRPYVFRLAFLDRIQGHALARYAWDQLDLKRIGVLTDVSDPYSRDLSALFASVFEGLGGTVAHARYVSGAESPAGAIVELADSGVSRVFLPIRPSDVVQVLSVTDERALGLSFLGADTWSLDAVVGFASAEGAVVSHQWHRDMPVDSTLAFVGRFRTRFGTDARTTSALTYDAVRLLAEAAHCAGSLDGAELRDALAGLPPYEGASGRIHFNGSGDPSRGVVLSAVHDGSHGPVIVIDPTR